MTSLFPGILPSRESPYGPVTNTDDENDDDSSEEAEISGTYAGDSEKPTAEKTE